MLRLKFLCIALTLVLFSCDKGMEVAQKGEASLQINLQGASYGEQRASSNGRSQVQTARTNSASASAPQQIAVPFADGLTLVATLTPDYSTGGLWQAGGAAKGEAKAELGGKQGALSPETTYRIVLFEGNAVKAQQQFAVGSASNQSITGLDAGQAYQVLIYSFGTDEPIADFRGSTISDVLDLGTDKRFMYALSSVTLNAGNNVVPMQLVNQFCEISSLTFSAANLPASIGNINAVSGVTVASRTTATYANGTVAYGNIVEDRGISFPAGTALNSPTVVSSNSAPVVFAVQGGAGTGLFKIGSLTIGSITKTNLELAFNVVPGTRYSLTIAPRNFTEENGGIEVGDLVWAPGNLKAVYKSTSQSWEYSFQSDQHVYSVPSPNGGELFMWRSLIPGRPQAGLYDGHEALNGWPFGEDPCAKVAPEWRTPRDADLSVLINAGGGYQWNTTQGMSGTYLSTGIGGRFYGSFNYIRNRPNSALPPLEQQRSAYVFLPYTRSYDFNSDNLNANTNYWSWDGKDSNGSSIHVREGYSSIGSWDRYGLNPIRCVRNK